MDNTVLSLYELNRLIRNTVSKGMPDLFWIRAETSDVRENQNGHCYLEFIEKDAKNKSVVAKARGSIWANVFQMLKLYFETETGQPFVSGLKVLVLVSIEFHELYGFSLNVHNIDPSYTLGDQSRNRTLIINQLKAEGVLSLNKELVLPQITNRVAIISSPTAAGYEDFCNQLENNKSGFVFYTKLFPAIMQGDKTEQSVLESLDKINEFIDKFDVVVLIRGGGATSDLSAFDSYLLAASCAQFPLPIITGIGHERDDTVLDIVSHVRVKTPTAAAEFLIDKMSETEEELFSLQSRIVDNTSGILSTGLLQINTLATRFSYLIKGQSDFRLTALVHIGFRLNNSVNLFLQSQKNQLKTKEQHLALVSPENILKRGYTLTLKNNKILKSASEICSGDRVTTLFKDGEKMSVAE